MKLTADILASALVGYRAQQEKIQEKITEIENELSKTRQQPSLTPTPRKKRHISPEGRARIAAAARRRWAAVKAVKKVKPLRKVA